METVTVSIPSDWVQGVSLDPNGLRQIVMLGLRQWRQQQPHGVNARVIQALLSTGRVKHLVHVGVNPPGVVIARPVVWAEAISSLKPEIASGLRPLAMTQPSVGFGHDVLATSLAEGTALNAERQTPPTLPGPAVSEIIITQRHGEL